LARSIETRDFSLFSVMVPQAPLASGLDQTAITIFCSAVEDGWLKNFGVF